MNEWAITDHRLSGLPVEVISDIDAVLSQIRPRLWWERTCPHRIAVQETEKPHRVPGRNRDLQTLLPEVLPKGANKGAALERLAKRLRIGMESVLAIGDARNDFDMIRRAGWGCAPANARERSAGGRALCVGEDQ